MKILTQEEFVDRVVAVQRARQIFLDTGLTNNITHAFIAYQEVLAERERQIFISTQYNPNRPQTVFDLYDRPKCPKCNADMMFRNVPENTEGIKVQLVCSKCDLVLSDTHDLQWWMENLKVKDEPARIS